MTGAAELSWFTSESDLSELSALGFRQGAGGVHLTKTMMLAELGKALAVSGGHDPEAIESHVLVENVLGKPTGSARKLVFSRLNSLYGLRKPLPIQAVMLKLWGRSNEGRPLLALLCNLAREPLLRETAPPVLGAPLGTPVQWTDLAPVLTQRYPGRYSPKVIRSLAQNCASTWTQAGHLNGRVAKRRARAQPTAETAAYAAYLGSLAGFGGPALLASPWMRVLDSPEDDLLSLLRRAEAAGLVQLRMGGGVIQINARRLLAQELGSAQT
jgi:hypothetical protein